MIWSGALMLDFLGQREAHDAIVRAIEQVLAEGPRTRDLGGKASTTEMGEAIARLVYRRLPAGMSGARSARGSPVSAFATASARAARLSALWASCVLAASCAHVTPDAPDAVGVQLGPRPFFLVDDMEDGALKSELQAARAGRSARASSRSATAARRCSSPSTPRVLRSGRAHGRRHRRVRRHLHQGQAARVPPRAERPAYHHEHPADAAGGQVHPAVHARGVRREWHARAPASGRVPHERHHAGGVQDARGKMDAFNPRATQVAGVLGGTAELPHRSLLRPDERHAADTPREHRAVQEARREDDTRAQGAPACRCRSTASRRRPTRRR